LGRRKTLLRRGKETWPVPQKTHPPPPQKNQKKKKNQTPPRGLGGLIPASKAAPAIALGNEGGVTQLVYLRPRGEKLDVGGAKFIVKAPGCRKN